MALSGAKAHTARLKRLAGAGLDREVGKALFAGAQRIQVAAQISITKGAVSGKKHVASRPGQPPSADTHHLADQIRTDLRFDTQGPVAEVSSNAEYSAPLEFGTSKMAARPFMAPARDAECKNVEALVIKAVKKLVGRSGR